MSYTTRSGRQAGRGQPQAQVTYHQTPRQLPNPAAFPQQFQHIQQATPLASQPAQPSPPGSSPQPLQMQLQQFMMQQQIKEDMETPTKPSMPPAPAVQSPVAIAHPSQPQSLSGGQTTPAEVTETTESKPWKKQKNPSFKVNKVQKRRRLNARFRKLLIPKNAIMVLNELQPGILFEADEQTNAFCQVSYTVNIDIDGVIYTGEGPSKAAAKAAAAELAVKGLILKKIEESSSKKDDGVFKEESMDTASGDETSEKSSINGRRIIPEDEVPWGSLASFALFKLFADWKAQGSNIPPVMTPPLSKPAPKVAAAPKPPATPVKPNMPENPETMHPVTLVGRLFPGTSFTEDAREGNAPYLTFTMGADVSGVHYTGAGKSKKEAKKNCAIEILKAANVPFNPN